MTKSSLDFSKARGVKLFLLISPLLALVFIFSYVPLYGWIYSVYNYKPGLKLSQCEFVGLEHFRMLFIDSYGRQQMIRVMKNTLGMSLIGIATSPLPMLFAIFLGEIRVKWFKKSVQTFTTIPNLISWVLVYAIVFAMFSVEDGFVNRLLMSKGMIDQGINFLAAQDHVWLTMWAYGTWKGLGWGAIVYIAAMSGIDQELYEAARCDGANRGQLIRNITVPCLIPTFCVLLILSISNFINTGMEQYFIFQNPMNKESIEVLGLYVYNQGLAGHNFSLATATGMLKSFVSVVLLFSANGMSKLFRGESIF